MASKLQHKPLSKIRGCKLSSGFGIKLIYVKDGNEYSTDIDRALFLDQMKRFVDWYSADGSNYNAQKLSDIIPVIDTIRINYSIIETQDVPFFEYTLI